MTDSAAADALLRFASMPVRRAANPITHKLSRLSFLLGVFGALAIAAAGPLHKYALAPLEIVLQVLRYGSYVALAGVALGLPLAWAARPGQGRRGFVAAMLGVIVGLAGAATPMQWLRASQVAPPINDISTDTSDPPTFVVLADRRRGARSGPEYPGSGFATLQRAAYPDIAPLALRVGSDEAFARAEAAAQAMGWEIVAAFPEQGRIEASARTRWFGFVDDVSIRVRAAGENGARIDVRSKSRVGVNDLGANAARIRAYLARIAPA
jgi:uncharacterized protein (DUF1499 family)